MIDANRGKSEKILRRLEAASYERLRSQLLVSIGILLDDFEMTWDDLADKLSAKRSGDEFRAYCGRNDLTLREINAIASVFSTEPYFIFRARFPWTQS